MKTIAILLSVVIIVGCSRQYTGHREGRNEKWEQGSLIALRSDLHHLTESVIFQVAIKRMAGTLENSKVFETELSRLAFEAKNESTRQKARLVLRYLSCTDNNCNTDIRSDYNEESRLYEVLEKYLKNDQTGYIESMN